MATIALYAGKLNQMPGLIQEVKKSVVDYKSELEALKNKTLQIDRNVCELEEVISSIQASSRIQDEKIASLEALENESEQFIEEAVRIDSAVAEVIRQRQDDFYDAYNYLKPDCEKSGWEKFCSFCKNVGEWCKEHWKLVVTIVLVIVAVVVIVCTAGTTLGIIATILVGAAKGLVIGAATGGLIGGISSVAAGGSFWEGFENGAFSGALSGALLGGVCGAGQVFGDAFNSSCKIFTAITYTSRISGTLAFGMIGFDILSLGSGLLFGQDNPLTALNMRLHESSAYNAFQFGISALAVFSASAYQTMKPMPKTCFVAGTMILTVTGLVAIEHIRAGDKVISTNPETFETAEKVVVETYVRQAPQLVHVTIGGEVIKTTADHPFYVTDAGFVRAGELDIGDKLIDSNGNVLYIEDIRFEVTKEPTTVYNFQVEDFHTYHVGQSGILVHNDCRPEAAILGSKKHGVNWQEGPARAKVTKKPQGKWVKTDIDYATKMANTLEPGRSAYFELPKNSGSIVYMPDGTIVKATKFWIKNNGITWHGYPIP